MMKFTRPITREIELSGERLAVTMGDQGVSFRPVGSRKPPREISWGMILCCATGQHCSPGHDAAPGSVTEALQALKSAPPAPTPAPVQSTEPSPEPVRQEAAHTAHEAPAATP
jgi:hypothetical protein